MKKFIILIFTLSNILFAQVGIDTSTPSSSIDINGSLQGKYRETNSTLINLSSTDYHLSFNGNSNSVLNLPNKSLIDETIDDFRGRKYYIKNNSNNSTLAINAVENQSIRYGGDITDKNSYTLVPGGFILLTANGINGWDIDVLYNNKTESSWKLTDVNSNNRVNNSQRVNAGSTYYQLIGSTLSVNIPEGFNESKVLLKFDGWGHTSVFNKAMGSLRFRVNQSGTSSAIYNTIAMAGWAVPLDNNTAVVRFNFPAVHVINNLSPGNYTFNLEVIREQETGATVNELFVFGIDSSAKVYSR